MDTPLSEPKYKMTIGLSVLEHLGVGLYSNVPAVLSEAVANAWDADAESVSISINERKREIIIRDDGIGMTVDDINDKYLKVGYKKRESEPQQGMTQKFKRHPMGRKGIGKLSLFSIADTIEIHTVKDDETNSFRMRGNDIRRQVKQGDHGVYIPEELPDTAEKLTRGTTIKLTNLKKRINQVPQNLRKRLARRFSIIGNDNFQIKIDGIQVSAADREYYSSIEYLWYFGADSVRFKALCNNTQRTECSDDNVHEELGYRIAGWVGTVKEQTQIDEESNGIAIFAHGKLVHENLLDDLKEGGVWTKYIIGEIDADFMDDSHKEDIITSARQSLKEDDERFEELRDFLRAGVLRRVGTNWLKWRRQARADRVLKERKNISRWYERLGPDQQKRAKQLIGKIEALDSLEEEGKKELYKSTMYAFERLSITDQLSILNEVESKRDFELISKIFGDLNDLAQVLYFDIAKVRFEIIRSFEAKLDANAKEKMIQLHLSNALWLLDPSWDRATRNVRMERTIRTEFDKVSDNLSPEEKDARIDIKFQTVSGKHVIIELKRYQARVNVHDLGEQVSKYRSTLQKCLDEVYPNDKLPIEIICLTGKQPSPNLSNKVVEAHLAAYGARFLTYDEVIGNALRSYRDYLDAEKRASELSRILESVENDFNA